MNQNTSDYRAVFAAAHDALRAAVLSVDETGWALATPCDQWNVTQVLQHAAGDQRAYAAAMTGRGAPTEDPFTPSGHLDDPAGSILDQALTASAEAWAGVADDATAPTPLPQGELPVWLGLGACALDAAVHAWDIAVATGQQPALTPELSRFLMTAATEIVEPLRAYGVYAAALEPQPGDDDTALLLRYLGRRPDWTAT